jgi:signal transduction histidine kinase
MRRTPWNTLPFTLNALLALLSALALGVVALRVIEQVTADQALARVAAGQNGALAAVQQTGAALAAEAAQWAERPALREQLQAGDPATLQTYFIQALYTSSADAVAIVDGGQVRAAGGLPVAWPAAETLAGQAFVAVPEGLALVTAAPLPEPLTGYVLLSRRLNRTYGEQAGAAAGLTVRIHRLDVAESDVERATLRGHALRLGQTQAAWLRTAGEFVAIAPLLGPDGAPVGVLETALADTALKAALLSARRVLFPMALGLAVLAGVANGLLGLRAARPMRALMSAAARIGQGDLQTPIVAPREAETASLTLALEEMRRRLLDLTANLQRQQAESDAILSGIVEGVFTVDNERRIRYLNPQAAELLGTTPQVVIGRFCGDVLMPLPVRGRRPCEDQCPILHARFQPGARATEHLALPGGRRSVVVTSAPPVQSAWPAGAELQVVVLRDETDVEATRRLRDTVLANISHEFRTPLSAQLASIELLLDQLPELNTDQIARLVISLQGGTVRLTQLIDNLLESVRIESGHDQVRRLPVALDEVVEQAVEMVRPLLDQRGQTVYMDLPYPLPRARGDAPRLVQVLVNLLANANKYAPVGTPISIGGHAEDGTVSVWVEDKGPGLPNLPPEALFGRFMRGGQADGDTSGAGLGLWIVQSIVARHGGRVAAENTGQGTRVLVTLPRAQADEAE